MECGGYKRKPYAWLTSVIRLRGSTPEAFSTGGGRYSFLRLCIITSDGLQKTLWTQVEEVKKEREI